MISTLLAIIILLILLILLILAVFLLVPFHLSLHLTKDGPSVKGTYRIGWMGRILQERDILQMESDEMEERICKGALDGDLSKQPEMEEKGGVGARHPEFAIRELIDALPALAGVLIDALGSFKVEKLSCRIAFGLCDPADTAVVSGYLWAVLSSMGRGKADVSIEPFFDRSLLNGSFLADVKARLLWIALALIKALREQKIRRLVQQMVAGARP